MFASSPVSDHFTAGAPPATSGISAMTRRAGDVVFPDIGVPVRHTPVPSSCNRLWCVAIVKDHMLPLFSITDALTIRHTSRKCAALFNKFLGFEGEHLHGRRREELEHILPEVLNLLPRSSPENNTPCWERVSWDSWAFGMDIVDFMLLHVNALWGQSTVPEGDREVEFISILSVIEGRCRFDANSVCTLDPTDPFLRSIRNVCLPLSLGQERLEKILRRCGQHLNESQQQWFLYSLYVAFKEVGGLQPEEFRPLLDIVKKTLGLLIFENFTPFHRALLGPEEALNLSPIERAACSALGLRELERFADRLPFLSEEDRAHILTGNVPPRFIVWHTSPPERLHALITMYRESRECVLPWDMISNIHLNLHKLSRCTFEKRLSTEEKSEHQHVRALCAYQAPDPFRS